MEYQQGLVHVAPLSPSSNLPCLQVFPFSIGSKVALGQRLSSQVHHVRGSR